MLKNVNMSRYYWLEKQLDSDLNMDDQTYQLYNTELNQLQEDINHNKIVKAQLEHFKALQITNRIKELYEQGKMVELIEEFGSEFKEDYNVDHESFTIRSYCKNDRNPNLTNFWQHPSLEECLNHYKLLLYYRIYNRYFRDLETEESYKVA